MNGRALPPDGPEMKAMLTYIRFISAGVPTGRSAEGRGAPPLPLPTAASDPKHGEAVFAETCAVCHQADGQGKRWGPKEAAAQRHRYQFPPLWGPDSYNDGAGMARPITAANFIRANMPFGTDLRTPCAERAGCVRRCRFVDSQQRPHRLGQRARLSRPRAEAGRRDLSAVPRAVPAIAASDRAVATDPAMAEGQRAKPADRLCRRRAAERRQMDPLQTAAAVGSGVIVGFYARPGRRRRFDSRGAVAALRRRDARPASGDRHQCARGRGQCVRQSRAARARAACPLATGADLRRRRIGRRLRRLIDRQGGGRAPAADPVCAADAVRRGDDAARAQSRFRRDPARSAADEPLAARCDRAGGRHAFRVLRDRWRLPCGARTDPRDRHADDRRDRVRAGRGRRPSG